MTIQEAYAFCLYVINKEQRGSFTPSQFNLLATIAQVAVINELLGNEQKLNERGVPPYGYKSNRKIDTLLKPLIVGPVLITPDSHVITAVTKSNPGQLTFASIGDLVNGALVYISGATGMTQLNGNTYMLDEISGSTAKLKDTSGNNVNTTAYGTYTASSAKAYPGTFEYPENYLWPDAIHKIDFTPIELIDSDQFPERKKSHLQIIDLDYPVAVLDGPKGFINPLSLTRFRMSYLAWPTDPFWAGTNVNDEPVYTGSGSVDFAIDRLGHLKICQKILAACGVNLDYMQVTQYATLREKEGT